MELDIRLNTAGYGMIPLERTYGPVYTWLNSVNDYLSLKGYQVNYGSVNITSHWGKVGGGITEGNRGFHLFFDAPHLEYNDRRFQFEIIVDSVDTFGSKAFILQKGNRGECKIENFSVRELEEVFENLIRRAFSLSDRGFDEITKYGESE